MRNEQISTTNGTAVISPDHQVIAGSWGTWTMIYTAGPDGIATGGSVRFEIPYGFTPPQLMWPGDVGYVSARCSRSASRLQLSLEPPVTLDPQPFYYVTRWGRMVYVQVLDEPLAEGDQITLEYGRLLHSPEPGGARAQYFAQTVEFTVATDADGTRSADFSGYTLITDQPILQVIGAGLDHLFTVVPSLVSIEESHPMKMIGRDQYGNRTSESLMPLVEDDGGFLEMAALEGGLEDARSTGVNRGLDSPGEYLLGVQCPSVREIVNPSICLPQEPDLKLFWGDIHGHTILSDGLGSPAEYYAFGREEALLDFCAMADHAQYMSDEDWELTRRVTRQFNDPGEYVTILGYEFSCNSSMEHYGDKCLYYPGDEGPLLRETDIVRSRYHDMAQYAPVWKQHGAMMVLHQHARGTCSYYDPDLVRLCEVYSIWGNSEMDDFRRPLMPARNRDYSGHYAADALEKGWILGFTGSSDDHAGRPGNSDWMRVSQGHPGGLVAVYAPVLTREAIWDALWNRRCYATTGKRIILEFHMDGEPMGSIISGSAFRGGHHVRVRVLGDRPMDSVEILCGREVIHSEGSFNCSVHLEMRLEPPPGSPNYYYVRATQDDGEMAWSSPIWII